MNVKTQVRLNELFERIVDIKKEIVVVRSEVVKEEDKFILTMAWVALLGSIAWVERLVQSL